jgi:hypothetical protein
MFLNSLSDGPIELMKRRKDKINLSSDNKKVFFIGLVVIAISGLAIFLYYAAVDKVNINNINNNNNNNDQTARAALIKEISNPTIRVLLLLVVMKLR